MNTNTVSVTYVNKAPQNQRTPRVTPQVVRYLRKHTARVTPLAANQSAFAIAAKQRLAPLGPCDSGSHHREHLTPEEHTMPGSRRRQLRPWVTSQETSLAHIHTATPGSHHRVHVATTLPTQTELAHQQPTLEYFQRRRP